MNLPIFSIPQVHAGLMDSVINQGQPSEFLIKPQGISIAKILSGGGVNLLSLVFIIIGLIFTFNIIAAGWNYLLSSGDPKKIAAASTQFINGFVGIAISFFAFIIVNLITNMIGLGSLL